jgi:sugar phosphate isomerase/epimerase
MKSFTVIILPVIILLFSLSVTGQERSGEQPPPETGEPFKLGMAGYSVEIGRGIIDFPAFVNMLREVNYTGVCSLEHEKNMDNPFMGIAESIGYFRGIIATTK